MKLREVGEDRLLGRLLPKLSIRSDVVVAAGDDCAVVDSPRGRNSLLLKTDCVVENIHYDPGTDPILIGWKAMMRPLSDFAAMSGVPQFALITLVVAREKESDWVKKIYRGLNRAAARFDVGIVGGETSNTLGPTVISVSVSGFVEKNRWISRGGGKAGDFLFVTGRLGGANRGKHLRFVPRIKESRWLTDNFCVHAMIDLSDGLGADLPRLARASKVGFTIDRQALPLARDAQIDNAISDGEDYELLFAISAKESVRLREKWRQKFPKLPLTCIGRLTMKSKRQSGLDGNPKLRSGFVHFK